MAKDMKILNMSSHMGKENMDMPKTKEGLYNAMNGMMKKMKKGEMENVYAMMMKNPNVDEGEHDKEDKEKSEAIERRVKDINVKEHVDALMNGEGDLSEEFKRKAATVFEAFKLGRAAIVAGAYDVRDAQANIIKIQLSKIIGYKSVDYLNGYMSKMAAGNTADAFHALSEGYGFIMSLQFTNDGDENPYFTKTAVDAMLANMADFWTVSDTDLSAMVSDITIKMNL